MLIQKVKPTSGSLASLLMTGLMVASSLLQPRYLQEVLDALLAGKYEAIYSIGAWLIGVALVGLVAGGLNVILAAYIAQGVSSDLREDAFRKIQTFSYANIEQFNAGNLVVRMTNDINQIQNVVMMTFQILFRLPLLFIGSFILAVQTLPSLWWVIVLMVVLIFGLTAVMMGMMGPRFAKFQTLLERINAIAKENLRGVRVVKSFVQEKEQFAKFTEVSDELLGQKSLHWLCLFSSGTFHDVGRLWGGIPLYLAGCGDGSVGSVSCWFHCFLCQLPKPDYLYHCYGWIFGKFCQSCHDFSASYSRNS